MRKHGPSRVRPDVPRGHGGRQLHGGGRKAWDKFGQASKLVSRLESELGVRLLNRTTRSVAPTEAGRAYYDRLKPLVDELDTLDLDIRNISQSPRGRLRLTAPLTFGTRELAPALNEFARHYPEIELDVSFLRPGRQRRRRGLRPCHSCRATRRFKPDHPQALRRPHRRGRRTGLPRRSMTRRRALRTLRSTPASSTPTSATRTGGRSRARAERSSW